MNKKELNKQELMSEIDCIPKFVLRDAAQKDKRTDMWIEDDRHSGVTEETNFINLAYVSKRYKLLQFESVFKPLLQNIEELEGSIMYDGGVGAMIMFPDDERLIVNGGDKIGLVAWNSVDKTSSVIINFCVKHDDRDITIPKSVAGFKRMHVGKAVEITENFLKVVDKIRDVWKAILKEFEKIKVTETYVISLMDELKIKEKSLRKKVLKDVQSTESMSLWDVFMKMLAIIEEKGYKSEVHRRKRLDKISSAMFNWAVAGRLIRI